MIRITVYVDPTTRFKLEQLMSECGFVVSRDLKYSSTGRVYARFLQTVLTKPILFAPTLFPNPTKRHQANQFQFSLPDQLSNTPNLYASLTESGLNTWNDFTYNLAHGYIYPSEYPRPIPSATLDRMIIDTSTRTPVRRFSTSTDVPQDDLPVPVLDPLSYTDNRPSLPPNEVLKGPRVQGINPQHLIRFAWYIPDLPRYTHQLELTEDDYNAALKLSEHFSIIPPTKRSDITRVTLVLESLYHNLLIRRF